MKTTRGLISIASARNTPVNTGFLYRVMVMRLKSKNIDVYRSNWYPKIVEYAP